MQTKLDLGSGPWIQSACKEFMSWAPGEDGFSWVGVKDAAARYQITILYSYHLQTVFQAFSWCMI